MVVEIVIGLVSLGLTASGVAFAVYRWRKKKHPEEDTDSAQLDRLVDLERERLERQKQEHQWQQFMDIADRVVPLILTDDDDEDY